MTAGSRVDMLDPHGLGLTKGYDSGVLDMSTIRKPTLSSPRTTKRYRPMRHLATLVLIALLVAACAEPGASGEPPAEPTAASTTEPTAAEPTPVAETQAPAAKAIEVKGSGTEKSDPFHLSGNYAVTWTAKADTDGGCFHGAFLQRVDGEAMLEMLANEMISDAKPHEGKSNLYNVEDLDYYVDASSGCDWTFTFTPA